MRRARSFGLRRACAAAAIAIALQGSAARAQTGEPGAKPGADAVDKAAAESLFQTARELMRDGKYSEACPKLAESQRLDPTLGTLLNLALCHEQEGKTASAWAEYREVESLAANAGQSERSAVAKEHADALEPKLSRLRIDLAADVPGLRILRNGAILGRGALGVVVAVDPGEHVITASAPGYREWSMTVTVGKERDEKSVVIPALEKVPEAPRPPDNPAPSPRPVVIYVPTPGERSAPANPLRTAGVVVGGVGIAAIAVGAVFGGVALSEVKAAEEAPDLCPDRVCSDEGYARIEAAAVKGRVSTISIGVGAAALAGGVVLLVMAAPKANKDANGRAATRPARGSAMLVPAAGPGGGALHILGSF